MRSVLLKARVVVLCLAVLAVSAISLMAQGKQLVNVDKNGVGIQGYDPVSYFEDSRPVMGDAKFSSEYNGVRYQFVSAEHKVLFDKDPAKYEPLFGGFCAYGASQNHKAPIKPEAWGLQDGRLVLNYDLDVLATFNKDPKGYLEKANKNWPGLVEKYGK
jgi:YHS domain-containing protein